MKKIHCIADVHIGNHQMHGGPMVAGINTRCAQTLKVFEKACLSAGCTKGTLWVAGDLHDTVSPSPQIITEVNQALDKAYNGSYCLKGNHDSVSDLPGDNALGPHRRASRVVEQIAVIYAREPGEVEVWAVPFRSGPASKWLAEDLAGMGSHPRAASIPGSKRVLIIHLGISDDTTAPWLRNANDSINVHELAKLCKKHAIDFVLAGNWHEHCSWKITHKGWDVEVCQVGALVPTGWDNPGLKGYGGFATVTVDGIEWEELPGPRFVKLQGSEEEVLAAIREADSPSELYVRLIAYPENYKKACVFVERLVADKIIAGGEVEMDVAEATADAKRAAQAATSAKSLDEAIDAFVSNMPIAPELSEKEEDFRARVKDLTNYHLTKVS